MVLSVLDMQCGGHRRTPSYTMSWCAVELTQAELKLNSRRSRLPLLRPKQELGCWTSTCQLTIQNDDTICPELASLRDAGHTHSYSGPASTR